MHSSTFSFKREAPVLAWSEVLGGAAALVLLFILCMEAKLAANGFVPSIGDSAALWTEQRARVSKLGTHALILIGGSRIQLALDLDSARRLSGLEPVQLAIDGSSFLPVLEGLAADEAVTGTIIVDYADHLLAYPAQAGDTAARYQAEFERLVGKGIPLFGQALEYRLAAFVKGALRSFADGARPIDSLRRRVMARAPVPQYLVMRADRSRSADYTRVAMPGFYHARVIRNLGATDVPSGLGIAELEGMLNERIEQLQPSPAGQFQVSTARVAEAVRSIERRGGRVIFTVLPTSGLVREINDRRFPRSLFYDPFAAAVGAPSVHFEDAPELRGFLCPDGSHLDQRDRRRFTEALLQTLGLIGGPKMR